MRVLGNFRSLFCSENGRSMVEMLGVLAIIGVLSIAGIAGYRWALNKYHTNEIINELNMRAVEVSAQIEPTGDVLARETDLTTSFPNKIMGLYETDSYITKDNAHYFEIDVYDIPEEVCVQILRDYEYPPVIFVNDEQYIGDVDLCVPSVDMAGVTMAFVYKNDLGALPTCGRHASLDYRIFACRCPTGTYLDSVDNSCFCPSGQIYSEKKGACIDSICEEGEFETLDGGCVPCGEAPDAVDVLLGDRQRDVCEACGDRIYDTVLKKCVKKCDSKYMMQTNGTCVPCASKTARITTVTEEECGKCSNRAYLINACVLKTYCGSNLSDTDEIKGSYFMGSDNKCYACDDENKPIVTISNTEEAKTLCKDCPNREVYGASTIYCRAKACAEGYFKDKDGYCRPCTTTTSYTITEDGKAACVDESCGRQVISNNRCALKACPNNTFWNSSMTCYSCSTAGRVYIGNDQTLIDACLACNKDGKKVREVIDGYCYKACGEDSYRDSSGTCRSCDNGQSYAVGKSATTYAFAHDSCKECGNRSIVYTKSNNYCVLANCPANRIRTAYGSCLECDHNSSLDISTYPDDDTLKDRCLSCGRDVVGTQCVKACATGQYRDAGGTCRSCTSPTAYLVGDDTTLRSGCTVCGDRHVTSNGYCALNCSSDQFETADGKCASCSIQGGVDIGTGSRERNSCNSCGDRFWNGSSCYPCKWDEALSVEGSEVSSCFNCSTRVVDSNGNCRLTETGNDF